MNTQIKNKIWSARGSVIVITALLTPVIFAVTLLGCDLGRLYILGSALQNSADLAALSGARALYNFKAANPTESPSLIDIKNITATVVNTNLQYPEKIDKNASPLSHETSWGSYSKDGVFTQDGSPLTAVHVKVKYEVREGKSFLWKTFGLKNQSVVREATAHFCPGSGGFVLLGGICPCGNAAVQSRLGETCDLGDDNGVECAEPDYKHDAPPHTCTYCNLGCNEVKKEGPYCGDGKVTHGEECDHASDGSCQPDCCRSPNHWDVNQQTCVPPPNPCLENQNQDIGEQCWPGTNNIFEVPNPNCSITCQCDHGYEPDPNQPGKCREIPVQICSTCTSSVARFPGCTEENIIVGDQIWSACNLGSSTSDQTGTNYDVAINQRKQLCPSGWRTPFANDWRSARSSQSWDALKNNLSRSKSKYASLSLFLNDNHKDFGGKTNEVVFNPTSGLCVASSGGANGGMKIGCLEDGTTIVTDPLNGRDFPDVPVRCLYDCPACPPTPGPTLIFGSDATIASGSTALLTWSTRNATTCTPSGGSAGWNTFNISGDNVASGSYTTIPLTSTTDFYLQCSGPGGKTDQKRVTITVNPSSGQCTESFMVYSDHASNVQTWRSCPASGGDATDQSYQDFLCQNRPNISYQINGNKIRFLLPSVACLDFDNSCHNRLGPDLMIFKDGINLGGVPQPPLNMEVDYNASSTYEVRSMYHADNTDSTYGFKQVFCPSAQPTSTLDLTVDALTTKPASSRFAVPASSATYDENSQIEFITTVRNSGTAAASNTALSYYFTLDASKKDQYPQGYYSLRTQSGISVPANGSTPIAHSHTNGASSGSDTYYIVACVDPQNTVSETSESNNCSSPATLMIKKMPVPTITLTAQPGECGGKVNLSWSGTNANQYAIWRYQPGSNGTYHNRTIIDWVPVLQSTTSLSTTDTVSTNQSYTYGIWATNDNFSNFTPAVTTATSSSAC